MTVKFPTSLARRANGSSQGPDAGAPPDETTDVRPIGERPGESPSGGRAAHLTATPTRRRFRGPSLRRANGLERRCIERAVRNVTRALAPVVLAVVLAAASRGGSPDAVPPPLPSMVPTTEPTPAASAAAPAPVADEALPTSAPSSAPADGATPPPPSVSAAPSPSPSPSPTVRPTELPRPTFPAMPVGPRGLEGVPAYQGPQEWSAAYGEMWGAHQAFVSFNQTLMDRRGSPANLLDIVALLYYREFAMVFDTSGIPRDSAAYMLATATLQQQVFAFCPDTDCSAVENGLWKLLGSHQAWFRIGSQPLEFYQQVGVEQAEFILAEREQRLAIAYDAAWSVIHVDQSEALDDMGFGYTQLYYGNYSLFPPTAQQHLAALPEGVGTQAPESAILNLPALKYVIVNSQQKAHLHAMP